MATIQFSVCPSADCTQLLFTDDTGRQPSATDGYGASAVLSTYTGSLLIKNPDGTTVIAAIPVTPETTGIAETITIADYGAMSDGVYEVIYEVKDENNLSLGLSRQGLVLQCSFACTVGAALAKLISCNCNGEKAESVIRARDYKVQALILANGDELTAAKDLLTRAQAEIKKANCNC